MSSLTRASDARAARRSHRSVEGDEKPHKMRERHRQTATKPRYYIRGIEITAQTGLGRIGVGVASPATSSTIIMSSTWASVVPAGTVPQDYPRHFDGLSGRPRASVSRRSPRSRAHRGHRAGFVEVGSGGDQGQHIEVSAGHAHQLQGLGLGRTLQKIVGVIVGAASRTGREHLQGSSPPDSTNVYGRQNHLRDVARGAVNLPRPAARHIVAPSQRRTRSELTMMSATLMLSPRPPSRSRDLASCPPSAQSGIEWSTVNFISLSDNRPRGRYALPTPQAPASSRSPACPGYRIWHCGSSAVGCPEPPLSARMTAPAQTA